jgi:hypothetical protein
LRGVRSCDRGRGADVGAFAVGAGDVAAESAVVGSNFWGSAELAGGDEDAAAVDDLGDAGAGLAGVAFSFSGGRVSCTRGKESLFGFVIDGSGIALPSFVGGAVAPEGARETVF